jgi:formylmethanofuran dehydrogenase subunit E
MADIRYNLECESSPVDKIGPYTWKEFLEHVSSFHNFPSPGVMIGGMMIDIALKHIPGEVTYNALCETSSCLPDSVQILTPCTAGNGRLKIVDLGRYAVSLYNKYDGDGVRVYLDPEKLQGWNEIETWLLKLKSKHEQDTEQLMEEIRSAGCNVYTLHPVKIKPDYLKKHSKGPIGICSICSEAYPLATGTICLSCQGQTPYEDATSTIVI